MSDAQQWPLGQLIQDRRQRLGLSQRAAAKRAGLSSGFWNQLETGKERRNRPSSTPNPSEGSLLQVSGALRLTNEDRSKLFQLAGRPVPSPELGGSKGVPLEHQSSTALVEQVQQIMSILKRRIDEEP